MTRIPLRLEVLKRITALLKTIDGTNGYHYDLKGQVHRGRTLFGNEDSLPMLSINEGSPRDVIASAGDNDELQASGWQLVIQGWVDNDMLNPTDPGYYLAADTMMCLERVNAVDGRGNPSFPTDYMLGPFKDDFRNFLITDFKIGRPIVSPPRDQVSSKTFFVLPVVVGLAEKSGQPYLNV